MNARLWLVVPLLAALSCTRPAAPQPASLQRWSERFSRPTGPFFARPLDTQWRHTAADRWEAEVGPGAPVALGGGVVAAAPEGLRVGLSGGGDGALRVEAEAGVWLESRLVGARPVPGAVSAGRLVYPQAKDGVDRIFEVTPGRAEELLGLETERAAQGLAYAIETSDAIAELKTDGSGLGLVAVDASGQARLNAPAPVGLDADGRRVEARLTAARTAAHHFTVTVTLLGTPRLPVLLDPSWVLTRTMAMPRKLHSTTLLADGQVLIAGGVTDMGVTRSAELYDPSTGIFTSTGNLNAPRSQHTATLLASGKVLLAGGSDAGSPATYLRSLDLYDPVARAFTSPTGIQLAMGRIEHTATLLADGTVLVAGGLSQNSGPLGQAEIYEPSTNTVKSMTIPMAVPRYNHAATLLPSGRVFITGGETMPSASPDTMLCESYAAGDTSFSTEGTLLQARSQHTATLLPTGGKIMVAGGYVGGVLEPTTETIFVGGFPAVLGPNLLHPRAGHTATRLPSGEVFFVGGQTSTADQRSTEVFNQDTGFFRDGPLLNTALLKHTATLLPTGQVLLAGGMDQGFSLLQTSQRTDLEGASWSPSGGHLHGGRTGQTATLLPSGRVLLVGGRVNGLPQAQVEIYDPLTRLFFVTGSLQVARAGHTATLLGTGVVLIAGGEGTSGQALTEVEVYNPGSGFAATVNSLHTARKNHTATLLRDGSVLVTGGESANGTVLDDAEQFTNRLWTSVAHMGQARTQHTATLLTNGKVLVVGGASVSAGPGTTTAELFDPNEETFTATDGPTVQPRLLHTATLLPNGQVLLAGGASLQVETYDPDAIAFTGGVQMMQTHAGHTATLLPSGRVLLVGGGSLSGVESYDPLSGSVRSEPTTATLRTGHTATLLRDGTVLVVGGTSTSTGELASAERFDRGQRYSGMGAPVLETFDISGSSATLSGEHLIGDGEGTGASATNHPVAVLERLDNGERLPVTLTDTGGAWHAISSTLLLAPPAFRPEGYYRLWLVTNGVPSTSLLVRFNNGCVSAGGSCDDGDPCTVDESCDINFACNHGSAISACPALGTCFQPSLSCPTIACEFDPFPDHTPCTTPDNNLAGYCDEGFCDVNGTPPSTSSSSASSTSSTSTSSTSSSTSTGTTSTSSTASATSSSASSSTSGSSSDSTSSTTSSGAASTSTSSSTAGSTSGSSGASGTSGGTASGSTASSSGASTSGTTGSSGGTLAGPGSSGSGSGTSGGLPGDAFGCQSTGPGLEWLALGVLVRVRRRAGPPREEAT